VEDIFELRRDQEEAFVFRYPLYERFLFILGLAAAAASALGRNRIHAQFADSVQMEFAAFGLIGLFVAACFWISFRAWQSKIIASPTALKARYLGQGVERVSWDHIAGVVYKWRLLGHVLVFHGTDGSRVRFRSSISGYDSLLRIIRSNTPAHILDQLDELLGEQDDEEEKEPAEGEGPEQSTEQAEPPREEEKVEDEEK
jgi:hypothetical protein